MNADEQLPEKVVTNLAELEKHDGFKMYLHAFEKRKTEITASICDTGVNDQETHDLKQQLKILETISPDKTVRLMKEKAGKRLRDYTPNQ